MVATQKKLGYRLKEAVWPCSANQKEVVWDPK